MGSTQVESFVKLLDPEPAVVRGIAFPYEERAGVVRYNEKVALAGYFFPDEGTMRSHHSITSMWAPELVVLRRNPSTQAVEILIGEYCQGAEHFLGKDHICGGYNRWQESDFGATCNRIATAELGVQIECGPILDYYKWRNLEEDPVDGHPYGHPLSLFVLVWLKSPIQETDKLRYVSIDKLPAKLIGPHRQFIERKQKLLTYAVNREWVEECLT